MVAPIAFTDTASPARAASLHAGRATAAREQAAYDAGLIRRFLAQDEAAFTEIVTRHRERIHAIALALLRNHGDAEEITQDVFVRAHRGLARFRGDSSLATWLHRIALNLTRNRYWYFYRRRRHLTLSFDSALREDTLATLADTVATEEPDPAREAANSEFFALVNGCMAQLGASHREILTRRNVQNRSYAEIGGEFGIKIGTVKSRIARARGSLRVLLARACPEFSPDASPGAWLGSSRAAARSAVAVA